MKFQINLMNLSNCFVQNLILLTNQKNTTISQNTKTPKRRRKLRQQ